MSSIMGEEASLLHRRSSCSMHHTFQIRLILLYLFLLVSLLLLVRLGQEGHTNQPIRPQKPAYAPFHIFAARGSGEPVGPGAIGLLAFLIQIDNPGTTLEAIDYPALIDPMDPTFYAFSSYLGTSAVILQVTGYYNRCPKSKIVLLGYSQVRSGPSSTGTNGSTKSVDPSLSYGTGCTCHW